MSMFGRVRLRSSGSSRRIAVAGFFLLVLSVLAFAQASAQDSSKRGRKYKAPPPVAHVEVTVVRDTNGKPIENAAVIFHPIEDGHNAGNMELKTNEDGKAIIDLLAIGSNVRVQIIASGFQTYGEDYKVDKDTMAIEVKLKRPVEQFSLYKKSEGKQSSTDSPGAKPDASKDAPKDAQPDAKPDGSQPDPPKDQPKPQDAQPK